VSFLFPAAHLLLQAADLFPGNAWLVNDNELFDVILCAFLDRIDDSEVLLLDNDTAAGFEVLRVITDVNKEFVAIRHADDRHPSSVALCDLGKLCNQECRTAVAVDLIAKLRNGLFEQTVFFLKFDHFRREVVLL